MKRRRSLMKRLRVFESAKQIKTRLDLCESIDTQDAYRRHAIFAYTGDGTSMQLIPMSAMNPILVCEEDGRSNGINF